MESKVIKKILILSHEFPPYSFGGVAYYTKDLIDYLSSQGYLIYVVTGRSNSLTIYNDRVFIYRTYFPDIPGRSLWFSIFSKSIIQKLLKMADVIIFNAGSVGFLPNWMHVGESDRRKKVISIFHGSIESLLSYYKNVSSQDKMRFLNPSELLYYTALPLYTFLEKLEIKTAHELVAVAYHIVNELSSLFPEFSEKIKSRSHIIYGGINPRHFKIYKTHRDLGINKSKIIYAYVGRLYLTKGVHHAVKAFEIIQQNLSRQTELWIFGKGPLEKWISRHAKKNKLNIKVFGFISRDKLMKLLARYVFALIFPSIYEGCPYALLEANALGIPVITWDMPWSREFVLQDINGYLAKPFSLGKLAEYAIKALSICDSGKIREVSFKYNIQNAFKEIEKLLRDDNY